MSLPLAWRTRLDTIPAAVPYIHALPDRLRSWSERLPAAGNTLRVGVVWRGNPKHNNDANRSIRFETFRRLFSAESCEFICLQLELNELEAATFTAHPACSNPATQVADFSDTAAIIAQLDLIVTVDTSVAHLAGAMGKPVWLLLPFSPDWRWLLHRSDSPWYPTMRLFRQPAIGDWESVIQEVGAELQRPSVRESAPCELQLQPA